MNAYKQLVNPQHGKHVLRMNTLKLVTPRPTKWRPINA